MIRFRVLFLSISLIGLAVSDEAEVGGNTYKQISAGTSAVPTHERDALVALYNSTDGANWVDNTNWLSGDPCSPLWAGVICTENDTTVISLDLSANNLSGTIPQELGDLVSLDGLFLYNNQMSGPIPPELGALVNLQYLYLYNNQLSDPIPPELGSLANLQNLYLYNNLLSGPIPPELGQLANLKFLYLYNNLLNGPIPPELGGLVSLQYLYIYNNLLSGPIPPELGDLANLYGLHIYNNQLSGPIPPELGNLASLVALNLHDNVLSGAIPPKLGGLAKLQNLYLYNNKLSGQIPAELGGLVNLQYLWFSGNQLSGQIPVELSDLSGLLDGDSQFGWNLLETDDTELDAFLDRKQGGDWSALQTVAPQELAVEEVGDSAVKLSWELIEYTDEVGRYSVWHSLSPGGPYSNAGATANKSTRQHLVTGLQQNTVNYFVVRAETDDHFNNSSNLVSTPSAEVRAQTTDVISCIYVITSPVGGEHWQRGADKHVTWVSSGIDCGATVHLDLYRGGAQDHTIAITDNDGNHEWLIPSDQALDDIYRVRVIDEGNSTYSTESPGDFTISFLPAHSLIDFKSCLFAVVAPAFDEVWQRGTSRIIQWGRGGLGCSSAVDIDLRRNGLFHSTIAKRVPNFGTYTWSIPVNHATGDQWSLRVYDHESILLGNESQRFGIDDQGTDFVIDYRVTGPWYGGPAENGHGWLVEVLDVGDGDLILLVYWYAFVEGEQIWMFGTGPVVGNTSRIEAFITSGPDFPPNYNSNDLLKEEWGDLDFIFDNETSGSVSWISTPVDTLRGGMNIQRISPLSFGLTHCQSGSWYNRAENGHGFVTQVVIVNGEEMLLVIWYVYLEGKQKWLLGVAPLVVGRANVDMSIFSDGDFPPDFNSDDVVNEPWGTVSFAYTGADTATASWTTDYPGYENGSMTLERLTSLSGHACR